LIDWMSDSIAWCHNGMILQAIPDVTSALFMLT